MRSRGGSPSSRSTLKPLTLNPKTPTVGATDVVVVVGVFVCVLLYMCIYVCKYIYIDLCGMSYFQLFFGSWFLAQSVPGPWELTPQPNNF